MLLNLLSNACKFQISGNITIRVWVKEVIRSIMDLDFNDDSQMETFITVEVQDRGKGMSKEKVRHIFEPFGMHSQV